MYLDRWLGRRHTPRKVCAGCRDFLLRIPASPGRAFTIPIESPHRGRSVAWEEWIAVVGKKVLISGPPKSRLSTETFLYRLSQVEGSPITRINRVSQHLGRINRLVSLVLLLVYIWMEKPWHNSISIPSSLLPALYC